MWMTGELVKIDSAWAILNRETRTAGDKRLGPEYSKKVAGLAL